MTADRRAPAPLLGPVLGLVLALAPAGPAAGTSPQPLEAPSVPDSELPGLVAKLDDPEVSVRIEGLWTLRHLETRELLVPLAPRMVAMMQSDESFEAERALALWQLAPLPADVRLAALPVLRSRGERARQHGDPFLRALANLDEPGNRALAEIARRSDPPARDMALGALRARPEFASFQLPVLREALRDPARAGMHGSVAQKIGYLRAGGAPAIAEMGAMLNSPYTASRTRGTIATSLGWIADPAAVPALRDALQDPVMDVRRAAAHALRQMGARP